MRRKFIASKMYDVRRRIAKNGWTPRLHRTNHNRRGLSLLDAMLDSFENDKGFQEAKEFIEAAIREHTDHINCTGVEGIRAFENDPRTTQQIVLDILEYAAESAAHKEAAE